MLTSPPRSSHIFHNDHQDLFPHRDDHGSWRVRYHRHSQAQASAKEEMSTHLLIIDDSVATLRMRTLSIATICRRFPEQLPAQLAACEMNQRDLRVLPVRTHPTCRHPACLSTACRKPKLTRIPAHTNATVTHSISSNNTADHIRFVIHTFRHSASDFLSAPHNISRPAFLATSFTLLLRSIASQRNSPSACFTPHHRPHSTTTSICFPRTSAFLVHQKKTWVHRWRHQGFLGIEQHGTSSRAICPIGTHFFSSKHHHLYNNYLWAYFRNSAFLVKDLLTA